MRWNLLGLIVNLSRQLFYTATYISFKTTGHEYGDKCLKQCVLSSYGYSYLTRLTSGVTSATLPAILGVENEFTVCKSSLCFCFSALMSYCLSIRERGGVGKTGAYLQGSTFRLSYGWMNDRGGHNFSIRGPDQERLCQHGKDIVPIYRRLAEPECVCDGEQTFNWETGEGRMNITAAITEVIYFFQLNSQNWWEWPNKKYKTSQKG